jgi:bleomycin hydrolase
MKRDESMKKTKIITITLLFIIFMTLIFSFGCSSLTDAEETRRKTVPLHYEYELKTTSIKPQIGGTCWAYTSVSFFESECIRMGTADETLDLSEMYMVYYAYVEKAREYLKRGGHNPYGQGGKDYDGTLILKKYGIVRQTDYDPEPDYFVSTISEIKPILDKAIEKNKEQTALSDDVIEETLNEIKAILDRKIGEVPTQINVNGKNITPLEYSKDVLKINPNDYLSITSFTHLPKKKYVELKLQDNWQHFDKYINVDLKDMINITKDSIKEGYSLYVCIDVSEPEADLKETGIIRVTKEERLDSYEDMVKLRQEQFDNGYTSEDHGMHLTGLDEKTNEDFAWFYAKNSWGVTYGDEGFMHISEYYIKLKVLSLMVHKDVIDAKYSYILPENS